VPARTGGPHAHGLAAASRGLAGGRRRGAGRHARAARGPGHPPGGGRVHRAPALQDTLARPRGGPGRSDRRRLGPRMSRAAVAAFPRSVRGNPYCDLLYRSLAARGVTVATSAELSPRWLVRHARAVKVLHLHWPEFYYRSGGRPTARS